MFFAPCRRGPVNIQIATRPYMSYRHGMACGSNGTPRYISPCETIDTDNAVIMDVEATRSVRQSEVGAVKTMIDRVQKVHDLMPERLIAGTTYGSGPMLDWLVELLIKKVGTQK